MSLDVKKFREMVFQMLYSCDSSGTEEMDLVAMMMHELKVTKKAASEAYNRVQTILKDLPEIDEKIRGVSTEYQFKRISSVEKNLLRLGVYELFYDKGLPPKVVIAEAIRLCRKFGTPESSQFVNAILDLIYKGVVSPCPSKSDSNPVSC